MNTIVTNAEYFIEIETEDGGIYAFSCKVGELKTPMTYDEFIHLENTSLESVIQAIGIRGIIPDIKYARWLTPAEYHAIHSDEEDSE